MRVLAGPGRLIDGPVTLWEVMRAVSGWVRGVGA